MARCRQRHVGARRGVVPAIVTGRHPDGTLLFILPLAVQRRNTIRQLTFLGSDLCDYNAPLLHRRFGALIDDAAFAALWRRITGLLRADRRFGFDVVDLPKMPERVGEQRNPLLVLGSKPNPSGAYLTALGGTWDDFYARKRSPATRKKERKQLRQLGEFGEIRFVDRLDGEERAKTLDLLFEQKARSFARMGVRNIFVRPGYQDLFRAFATEPQSRHLVHLSRLEVGDTVAAASIGFTACDCYYLVLSSYDGGAMARFGPGRTHLHELLRFAIGGDFRCFDFTIGDELYKRDWSDARLVLQDHLSAASWRGRVVVSLITGFRAMKRAVKQKSTAVAAVQPGPLAPRGNAGRRLPDGAGRPRACGERRCRCVRPISPSSAGDSPARPPPPCWGAPASLRHWSTRTPWRRPTSGAKSSTARRLRRCARRGSPTPFWPRGRSTTASGWSGADGWSIASRASSATSSTTRWSTRCGARFPPASRPSSAR